MSFLKRALKRSAIFAVVLLVFTFARVQACAGGGHDEVRLEYLAQRINHRELPGLAPGHPFDGEWRLTALTMSVLAATNLSMRAPQTREQHARQVGEWVAQLASDEVRAYDTRQWGGADPLTTLDQPGAHAGYLGQLLLAMDAACLLGAERDESLHRALAASMARRLEAAPHGLLETYPGEIYVPDNVVTVAGLAQFDACQGRPEHAALIARWLTRVRTQWADPENGLLVFAPGQRARGSGAAWNSMFLPLIDARLARDQSDKMWATFGDEAGAGWLRGIREGGAGEGDVDSGPLVLGVSPSATGFALADATWHGRPERAGLLRTAELVGVSFGDHYLFSPLVGDAITLAARTATPWTLSNGALARQ